MFWSQNRDLHVGLFAPSSSSATLSVIHNVLQKDQCFHLLTESVAHEELGAKRPSCK